MFFGGLVLLERLSADVVARARHTVVLTEPRLVRVELRLLGHHLADVLRLQLLGADVIPPVLVGCVAQVAVVLILPALPSTLDLPSWLASSHVVEGRVPRRPDCTVVNSRARGAVRVYKNA